MEKRRNSKLALGDKVVVSFLGSPHNLNEKLFDKSSIFGSFSQVSSIELNIFDGCAGGHPQVSHPQLGYDLQHGVVLGHGISKGT